MINVDITNPNQVNVYGTDDYSIDKNKLLKEIKYVPMLIIENDKGKLIIQDNYRVTPDNIEKIFKNFCTK